MGMDKRLLRVAGGPLIARTVEVAHTAGLAPIVVVLREDDGAVRSILGPLDCRVVARADNDGGMRASLREGLAAIDHVHDGVVVMLPDMPAVEPYMIRALLGAPRDARAVVSRYGQYVAPPILFRPWGLDLLASAGDGAGARLADEPDVHVVSWPAERGLDVDRPEDVVRFAVRLYHSPPRSRNQPPCRPSQRVRGLNGEC